MSSLSLEADGSSLVRVRPRSLSRLTLALLLASPLLLYMSWAKTLVVWRTGAFFDTDDAMRAVQVRDWMAGQGWFDLAAHRLGPPEGLVMHWSRVVDVPLAWLIGGFDLVLPRDLGERAARIAFPVLLQFGLVAAMAYAARLLAGARAVLPAAFLLTFGGIGYTQFQPGRIDHHAPQILLLVLMTATLLDGLDPARARRAALSGVAVAVSLAISLENLPFVAVILAALPVLWWLDGARYRSAMLWLALGLGVAAPLLFVATVPPWRYVVASVDAYSAPHLLAALLAAATLVILALASPRVAGSDSLARRRRTLLLLATGGVTGALLIAAFPHCLAGPFAETDPEVKRLWLDHVREVQPLIGALRQVPASTLPVIGPIALASLAVLAATIKTRDLARRRWAVLAVLVAVGIGGTVWAIRVVHSLQPLALLGGAWAVGRLFGWARREGRDPKAIVLPYMAFLLCSSLCWSLLPLPSETKQEKAEAAGDAGCQSPAALAPLSRLSPARVFAPLDEGPFLLAQTGLSTVAGPYHRNTSGNLAVLTGFTASPDAARDIVRRTGARLVIVCGSETPAVSGSGDLATALVSGHPPAWLTPVPVGATPYRVYAVE